MVPYQVQITTHPRMLVLDGLKAIYSIITSVLVERKVEITLLYDPRDSPSLGPFEACRAKTPE